MYIEFIFLINYVIDFLILFSVSLVLRRNVRILRIFLTSLIGALSLMYLFVSFNNIGLIIFKLIISIILNIICFGYKDIKYFLTNLTYFYSLCFILGGFLYYIKIEYSYVINYKVLLFLSPIILIMYIKQAFNLKNHFSLKHKVDIYLKSGRLIRLDGYMDSGNTLVEPYNNNKVIILSDKKIIDELDNEFFLLVPYKTIDKEGFIKCIIPKKVFIEGFGYRKDVVLGLMENDLNLSGVNCLLNYKLMEEL